tara:strand:- start:1467 stop:2099 length:633 start_codon:yes stop_codon:yes gene_type:complete
MVEKDGVRFGMDAKTRRLRRGWGQSGTTDVPLDVEIQMRVYMEIFDTPYWDIATLFGLDDFRVYRIHRDKELGESILDVAEAWWENHVENEVPPDVDATDACKKVLSMMNDRVKDDPPRVATVAEKDLHEKLLSVKDKIKNLERERREMENILRAKIGTESGIQGVATWKLGKPRKVFDKESFREKHPKLYDKFVVEKPGTRILRVKEAT